MVANVFKDLFFDSAKQFKNIKPFAEQQALLVKTVDKQLKVYDSSIIFDTYSYYLNEPLLNNDYSLLYTLIQEHVKFDKSDAAPFSMQPFAQYNSKPEAKSSEKTSSKQQPAFK